MSDSDVLATWAAVATPTINGDLFARPAPRHPLIRLAVDHQGRWHLLVPAAPEGPEIRLPPMHGLELNIDELRVDRATPSRYYDLLCRDAAYNPNLARLTSEVLDELDRGISTHEALAGTLRRWRRFWGNRPGELGREEIIGLFGELWFLEHWLGSIDHATLAAWTGPDRSRHDFQWAEASIEVKATAVRSDGPATHRIAGLDQLAAPDRGQLHLFSLRLASDRMATHSLGGSIRRISAALASLPDALGRFEDLLGLKRITPADLDRYDETFRVTGEELYLVDEDFPKLTSKSFADGLPTGVDAVSYTVDLVACAPWLLETAPGAAARRLRDSLRG